MSRARRRGIALKLATALLSTIVTLGAVELYVRATYRENWYAEPDFQPGRFPRLNSVGLRDVDHGPKAPGSYRILLLGDSFTFGSGVEDDNAIWPAILERRLGENRPLPGISTYEVLNAGIAGSLTDQWVGVYLQQRGEFRPDLVLVVFFLRDGTNLQRVTTEKVAQKKEGIARDPLAQVSMAYRYLLERWTAMYIAGELEGFMAESYVGDEASTEEWRRAQRNLLTLRDVAATDGSRFGVAGFPVLYGLDEDPYPFEPAMGALERFCRANDIPYRSLLPAFRGRRASALWVSIANQHPNAEGHALAAGALLPFALELMEAPPSAAGRS